MDNDKRILDKSKELFFRFGLRNITMDRIAQELGISKKTLYASYDTKNTIVKNITREFLRCQESEMDCIAQKAGNAIEELVEIMANINKVFESMDFNVIYDMQRYFPESWQMFSEHKDQYILRGIIDNLNKGKSEGLYRQEINVEIIARARIEQIQLAMNPEIFPPEKFSVKEIHSQLLLHYVHGISTLKGHKLVNQYLNKHEEH